MKNARGVRPWSVVVTFFVKNFYFSRPRRITLHGTVTAVQTCPLTFYLNLVWTIIFSDRLLASEIAFFQIQQDSNKQSWPSG